MNIREALLAEHSKNQVIKISGSIKNSASRMATLMRLYFGEDKILSQRAAWVLSTVTREQPGLILPYLKKLMEHLRKPGLHDSIKRNGIKCLEIIEIPKGLYGTAINLCFDLLSDPAESVATRCYALTVLSKICREVPELKKELKLVMETALPFSTPGFRSRIKRTMKEIG